MTMPKKRLISDTLRSTSCSERPPHAQPRRCCRSADDWFQVIRVRGVRERVVAFLETVAFVEEHRPLRVEDVENVEEDVELRTAERDGVAEVDVGVVVARSAAFGVARSEEEFVAPVGVRI